MYTTIEENIYFPVCHPRNIKENEESEILQIIHTIWVFIVTIVWSGPNINSFPLVVIILSKLILKVRWMIKKIRRQWHSDWYIQGAFDYKLKHFLEMLWSQQAKNSSVISIFIHIRFEFIRQNDNINYAIVRWWLPKSLDWIDWNYD